MPRIAGRHYQLAARDSLAQQSLCCLSPGRDTRDRAVGALVVPLSLSLSGREDANTRKGRRNSAFERRSLSSVEKKRVRACRIDDAGTFSLSHLSRRSSLFSLERKPSSGTLRHSSSRVSWTDTRSGSSSAQKETRRRVKREKRNQKGIASSVRRRRRCLHFGRRKKASNRSLSLLAE